MALKQVPVTVWDPSYTLPNWFGTWLDAHSSDCLSPKTVLKWDMFVGVAAFLAQAVLGMLAKVGTRSRTSVSGCEDQEVSLAAQLCCPEICRPHPSTVSRRHTSPPRLLPSCLTVQIRR